MRISRGIILILALILAATAVSAFHGALNTRDVGSPQTAVIAPNLLPLAQDALIEPVNGFVARAIKKQFGAYITPDTSPIEGDRFAGYHTGVDAEFTDVAADVPVRAIADGTIISRTWAHGYGGVVVIRHMISGVPIFALYGHLDEASFPPNITEVKAGDIIGILGDDHSHETDGVRKHLHFGLYWGEKIDYRGYVPTEEELVYWLDPLNFF